jgi:hypothetical protein
MNLNLLLPYEHSCKVIFLITGEHGHSKEGHRCAVAKKGGKIAWFDPYGLKADSEEK